MGKDEPIEFTRGDAERLRGIEDSQHITCRKIDKIITKVNNIISTQTVECVRMTKQIDKNTRFRRIIIRVLLWIITTSTSLGIIAAGAKAMNWIN